MKVTELQSFVRTLAQPLSSIGVSKTVCGDLERVAAVLEPFREMTITQFADFLTRAEEYQRTGILAPAATRSRSKAAKVGPLSLAEAVQRVQAIYERAADPALEYTDIDAEINKLDKALNKDQMLAVAREMGIAKSLKSKKAAGEEIKRKIMERKGSFERTQFRTEEPSGGYPGSETAVT